MEHTFVALPDGYDPVFLFDQNGKKFRQVLWGDWLWIDDTKPDTDPNFRHILWSPKNPQKRKELRIPREHTVDARPLEIIFVDVGQGDGCVLITPERGDKEAIIVIDAGKGEEMGAFLDQRFKSYKQQMKFHAAVITHPDEDHYGGFEPIFAGGMAKFAKLYHSGLVERPVPGTFEKVGGLTKDLADNTNYCEALVETDAQLRAAFSGAPGSFVYPLMMSKALGNVDEFAMLSTAHGAQEDGKAWMPGFAPSNNRGYTIEVLGPWVEQGAGGKKRLRKLGSYGETKNGHSVVLKLNYRDFRVIFSGDLNVPAERFLLQRHTATDRWPRDPAEREAMMTKARPIFRSEVLKVCHHGSADVTDEFLEAVEPAAFVISSGDQEGHVHPRPDLLGRLGRKGRGTSPVLLSTELQRSTRAAEDERLVKQLKSDIPAQIANQTAARARKIEDAINSLGRSNVDVDGAIYVKTDGQRLIAAFKKEERSDTDKWFYFQYRVADGKLLLEPR